MPPTGTEHYGVRDDKDRTLFCRLPIVSPDEELGDGIYQTDVCGADLYLKWDFSIPLSLQMEVTATDAPSWAVAHGWEVVCTNGHTLATSTSGVDYAETLRAWMVFPQQLDFPDRARPE